MVAKDWVLEVDLGLNSAPTLTYLFLICNIELMIPTSGNVKIKQSWLVWLSGLTTGL